jgi:capsular polysaccharide biosynthesis protein
MQENVQQKEEGGISLFDIFRLLLSKIKLLILVVIAAGIVGGGLGLYTSWNDLYFGTRVEFYVNPEKPKETSSEGASQFGVYGAYGRHVMDNMIKLLESESFTEQLLLDGETLPKLNFKAGDTTPLGTVVPEGNTWSWTQNAEVHAKLFAALEKAKESRAAARAQEGLLETLTANKNEKILAQNELNKLINNEWVKFYPQYTQSAVFSEAAYKVLLATAQNDANLKKNIQDLETYYNGWLSAKTELSIAIEQINDLNENYFKTADKDEKAALELWRTTEGYKSILKMYSDSITYSYLEANADVDDANNLARSFIYIDISVVGEQNQNFAKEVHERVKDIVPEFVKANMTVPADYQGTNCERITRTDEIQRTNPNYRAKQAIKFAILAAAAAFVMAAVIVIIVDRSDKRLRETEIITKKFDVPVLGIVPSIEELNEEAHAKKVAATKAAKTSTKEEK